MGSRRCWSGLGAAGAGAAAADYGTLDFQLSWIKNVEFAGAYIADTNGYYKKQGFAKVTLLSGGPTVQQDAVVAVGQGVRRASPRPTSRRRPSTTAPSSSIDRRAVPEEPVLRDEPGEATRSRRPQDMIGKKIGVQATNEAVWNAFLKANNIDPSKITKVPVQFDPTPLANGEVDGWFSFFTNEPNLLKLQGRRHRDFLLADYKYPLVSETYVVKSDTLDRATATSSRRSCVAEIKGWHDNLKDPALGATLAANEVRQGPEAHGGGADARVQGRERADPHRRHRRRTACSRSPTSCSTRTSTRWRWPASTSPRTSCSTCRCSTRSTTRTRS